MVVGNAITNDTRVIKTALAMKDGGAEVTVLGYNPDGGRTESDLAGVRMIRVGVPWTLRDANRSARAAAKLHGRSPVPAVAAAQLRVITERAKLRAGEMRDLGGVRRAAAGFGSLVAPYVDAGVAKAAGVVPRRVAARMERLRSGGFLNDWRLVIPDIDDYTVAFRPVVDELDWDVLHAHDVHHMGLAAQAVAARRRAGDRAAWVYDAHEYVRGLSTYKGRSIRKVRAYHDLEREFIHDADAVCTVSPELATRLQADYHLLVRPDVVMNAPDSAAMSASVDVGLRDLIGLEHDVPVLVYSGGVSEARGVQTAVKALPSLAGYHLAVVCVPHPRVPQAVRLGQLAEQLGVADRVHLVEPVRPDQVAAFVASADIGLIPIRRFGSHEVALANKLFEYTYAQLPVLVSDMEAQQKFVTEHGLGLVHRVDDAESFADQARALMARRGEFVANLAGGSRLAEYSWDHQAESLRRLYRDRLGLPVAVHVDHNTVISEVRETPLSNEVS